MSAGSEVWVEGKLGLTFVPPVDAEPIPQPFKDDPRLLIVKHVFLTLYCMGGSWRASSVVTRGVWARKSDGQPSRYSGYLTWSAPLSEEEGAPGWLVARVEKLVVELTAAMKAAEQ